MTIVLSCGCEVSDFDHTHNVMYQSYDRKGNKAIAYASFCGSCEDRLRQIGVLFDTEEAAKEWVLREK